MLAAPGMSDVTVLCASFTFKTVYGPSNFGRSFLGIFPFSVFLGSLFMFLVKSSHTVTYCMGEYIFAMFIRLV